MAEAAVTWLYLLSLWRAPPRRSGSGGRVEGVKEPLVLEKLVLRVMPSPEK